MDDINLIGSQRVAAENSAGKYLYTFTLAALGDLHDKCLDPDGFAFSPENGYDSFDNVVSDEPVKRLKRPIVVMRDAKTLLASLFATIVSVVNEGGRVPAANIKGHLVNVDALRKDQVSFMVFVAEAMWPLITSGRLDRELDATAAFRSKIEALVTTKAYVEASSGELARIFVRFLKCVAWATANFHVEHRVTMNAWFLKGLVRNFGALHEVAYDELMSEFFRGQIEWVRVNDTAAKAVKAPAAVAETKTVVAETKTAVAEAETKTVGAAEDPPAEVVPEADKNEPTAGALPDGPPEDLSTDDFADLDELDLLGV